MEEYNIIAVDWRNLPTYSSSKDVEKHVNKLGERVGRLIEYLIKNGLTKPSDIHVIGLGMGSDIAAYAGRYVNGTIGRYDVIKKII